MDLDARRKSLIGEVESLKAKRNRVSEEIAARKKAKENADSLIAEMKAEGEKIKALDAELAEVQTALEEAVYAIPNIPNDSVPKGKDDSENKIVRTYGKPTEFSFPPKAHWDIGEALGILDPAAGAKISGARFMVSRGWGAKLERALVSFMLDTHSENGYTEILPPFLVNRDSMTGTGQLPKFEEDMYAVKGTDYYLIPPPRCP